MGSVLHVGLGATLKGFPIYTLMSSRVTKQNKYQRDHIDVHCRPSMRHNTKEADTQKDKANLQPGTPEISYRPK